MNDLVDIDFSKYETAFQIEHVKHLGRVIQVVGLTMESLGPICNVGDVCYIRMNKHSEPTLSEVVGFRDNRILLMPLGSMDGIGPGSVVEATGAPLAVKVGSQLLGRVLDGLGNPIDGKGEIESDIYYPTEKQAPDPMKRIRIKEVMPLGIKAIDGLLTVGKGQRIGIFAGSGVGKSTLMGMIARNTKADINVIGLVGERGRELKDFIDKDLGAEGLANSVIVVATSDKPSLIRLKAAQVATTIAEYFRDQGKDVLLLMDSLTRYSMAQREVGLATGEPPVSKGYTPSVFSQMPKLLERAGTSDKGSITGLYTVLVDGDDLTEPVTDTARGILDGHIVLSRKLANNNHYPAIDILASISRVMSDIVSKEHKKIASEIKKNMATYAEAEDLINIGAYIKGSNPDIDIAIQKNSMIKEFLLQDVEEKVDFDNIIKTIKDIVL